MVPAVGLKPMRNYIKACVYAALRRPTAALIGTNWYVYTRDEHKRVATHIPRLTRYANGTQCIQVTSSGQREIAKPSN